MLRISCGGVALLVIGAVLVVLLLLGLGPGLAIYSSNQSDEGSPPDNELSFEVLQEVEAERDQPLGDVGVGSCVSFSTGERSLLSTRCLDEHDREPPAPGGGNPQSALEQLSQERVAGTGC